MFHWCHGELKLNRCREGTRRVELRKVTGRADWLQPTYAEFKFHYATRGNAAIEFLTGNISANSFSDSLRRAGHANSDTPSFVKFTELSTDPGDIPDEDSDEDRDDDQNDDREDVRRAAKPSVRARGNRKVKTPYPDGEHEDEGSHQPSKASPIKGQLQTTSKKPIVDKPEIRKPVQTARATRSNSRIEDVGRPKTGSWVDSDSKVIQLTPLLARSRPLPDVPEENESAHESGNDQQDDKDEEVGSTIIVANSCHGDRLLIQGQDEEQPAADREQTIRASAEPLRPGSVQIQDGITAPKANIPAQSADIDEHPRKHDEHQPPVQDNRERAFEDDTAELSDPSSTMAALLAEPETSELLSPAEIRKPSESGHRPPPPTRRVSGNGHPRIDSNLHDRVPALIAHAPTQDTRVVSDPLTTGKR